MTGNAGVDSEIGMTGKTSVAGPAPRRESIAVRVGGVDVGGSNPVVVQSMTNTDTADLDKTVVQVAALARAGSELVRITVDRDEAAKAVPHIKEQLLKRGVTVPLVGDFHWTNIVSIPGTLVSRIRRTSSSALLLSKRCAGISRFASASTGDRLTKTC